MIFIKLTEKPSYNILSTLTTTFESHKSNYMYSYSVGTNAESKME